jgi:branched-chain amino acid transport system ATP-binding protein
MDPLLAIEGLRGGYGRVEVLRGVDLHVAAGEVVALLGSNGAGKSTLNNTVCGLCPAWSGRVRFDGAELTRAHYKDVVRAGLIQVPEGRRVFPNLTVLENLELGSFSRARAHRAQNIDKAFAIFPRLKDRVAQRAGTLSGGEQQMLAIGRGLMAEPRLLILDEPSLGLAPLLVQQIREIVQDINQQGTSVLLIEQNAVMALSIAHYGYVMETGRVVLDGPAQKLLGDEDVREFYLGLHGEEGERKSFRDVKHYKRRKRWLS